jgi:hypothetical protein
MVHTDYAEVSGHPFLNPGNFTTRANTVYCVPTFYDSIFSTNQLRHWNCNGYVEVEAKRFIPKPEDSIFAGTK